MNWKYAALALAAIMILAPALTLTTPAKAQATGQVTFNVLTAEVSPKGYIIFIINNTWLDEEYQLGAGVSGEIYIDFDQLERISDVAIPLIAPDNRSYATYIDAIYNDTTGTGATGVDPGRIPLTGTDQNYTVIVLQMPAKEYFYKYKDLTHVNPFGVPLYLKIWTGAKTIVSKGSFIIRDTALKLALDYNPAYTQLSYVGSLFPFLDGVFNVMEGTLKLTWGDGTTFNFTKYTSDGHYLNATLTMVNVDNSTDTHLLLYASLVNSNGTVNVTYASDVLYNGTGNITASADTSTFYFKDRIGNFSVFYAPDKTIDKGKALAYAEYGIAVSIDTNLDKVPFVLYFNQPDRKVEWVTDNTSTYYVGIYINIVNNDDAARGVYIENKTIYFYESPSPYGGDLLGFGNLTATAKNADLSKGVLQLEWYKRTADVAGVNGFAGKLADNTFYTQFFYTLTSTLNIEKLTIYPSVEMGLLAAGGPAGTIHIDYATEYNVGDEIFYIAHHLPADANLSKVCLFQYNSETGKLFDGVDPDFEKNLTVAADGTLYGTVYFNTTQPYAGNFYYLVVKVIEPLNATVWNENAAEVRTWPTAVGRVYPILELQLIQPDGSFAPDLSAGLGDYALVTGYGFNLSEIDVAKDITFVFITEAGDMIPISVLTSTADGLLIEKLGNTSFRAIVRIPYDNYLFTDLGTNFLGVIVAAVADNPMYHKGSTADITVKTDGQEAKVFLFPVQTPVEDYITWDGVVLPTAITGKYPYEAWETINQTSLTEAGYTEDMFKFYAEIIGAPYARLFIDVGLKLTGVDSGYSAIAQPAEVVGGQEVNGYALVIFNVPTVPNDAYVVTLASATETFTTALNNAGDELTISVDCIMAVAALKSGKPEYYVVPGTYNPKYDVHVLQDGLIGVIGFGFGSGEAVTISVYGAPIVTIDAAADGTFNATFAAGYVITVTGVYTGFYTIDVQGAASGCAKEFTAWIEEIPTLLLRVQADPVVYPGELTTVAIKVMFQYSNIVRTLNITAPQDLYQIDYIKVSFIYYRASTSDPVKVVTKTLTYDDFQKIVNEKYFTCMGQEYPAEYYEDLGLLVLRFPMDGYNKSVVIDVVGQVTFANGVVTNATDYVVVSLEDYLYGTLSSIDYNAIVGAITAYIDTAKGEILADLATLKELVQAGFDNVTLKLDAIDGKVSDVLAQIAMLETLMAGNFTQLQQLIENKTAEILAALENINVTAPAEVNLTELYAFINATAAEITTTILGAINASTAALQITITATGDYVVQTLFGKIELTQQQLAQLINDAKIVTLEALNNQTLALTAYLDAKAIEVTGNMTNITTALAEQVMADIAEAVKSVKAYIDVASGKLVLKVSDIVDAATTTVVGTVYYFLFGEELPAITAEVNVSVKDLIEASKSAVITAVNDSAVALKAEIGSAKAEIVASLDQAKSDITSAIDAKAGEITSAVKTEVGSAKAEIADAINAKAAEITNTINTKTDDLSQKIDSLNQKVDSLSQQQSQSTQQLTSNVNSVKTIAIVDAILAIIAIILIGLVFSRLRTAG